MAPTTTVDVVVMDVFGSTSTLCADLARALRSRGYNVDHLRESSIKRATRYLDRSDCYVGVMIGERESAAGVVRVIETLSAGWLQYDVSIVEFHEHYLFR
jgi:histidyl-tRNA synthetase